MSLYHPHAQTKDGSKFREAVAVCIKALEQIEGKYDIIAVRGASGTVIGSVVAYQLNKLLMVVRKNNERVHCYQVYSMYGEPRPERTVFLDDFIERGGTYRAIIKALGAPPMWVMLYSDYTFQLYNKEQHLLQDTGMDRIYTPMTNRGFRLAPTEEPR